ncbi:MAG: hypothetical protein ACR2LI_14940 [Propionibacteriaceae bacterium]
MKKLSAVLAAVGLVLGGATLTGCAGGPAVECGGKANNVHHSSGTSSSMDGKVTGSCTAAVSINGYVEIQQKTSRGWVSIKRTSFSLVSTPNKKFTRMAATKCRKGTFRLHSHVVGTYKGQSQTRNSTSGQTKNPCV